MALVLAVHARSWCCRHGAKEAGIDMFSQLWSVSRGAQWPSSKLNLKVLAPLQEAASSRPPLQEQSNHMLMVRHVYLLLSSLDDHKAAWFHDAAALRPP
jgi:hypothetical protein